MTTTTKPVVRTCKTIAVHVSYETHGRLTSLSRHTGLSMGAIVRELVAELCLAYKNEGIKLPGLKGKKKP